MESLSATERETAKAIHRLAPDGGAARTGDLAAALSVAPASATARVQRLAEGGLASYAPYRGVELTAQGRAVAVAAIRRHRIVERFLSAVLGYPWEDADRLAVTFEHDVPDEVIARLYAVLDRPATCPRGFPIPAAGSTDVPTLPTLDEVEAGVSAHVALPGDTDRDVSDFLETIGIRPGVRIVVREHHPFGGPVVVTVGGEDRTIGNRLARQIFVRVDCGRRRHGAPGARSSDCPPADASRAGGDSSAVRRSTDPRRRSPAWSRRRRCPRRDRRRTRVR